MARSCWRGSQGWSGDYAAQGGEPPLARRRRLKQEKSRQRKRAVEVDRSGSVGHLERAAKRLKHADANERVLCVQHWNLDKAIRAMQRAGVDGVVTNITASELRRVSARQRY
jgi:hypothetical protein